MFCGSCGSKIDQPLNVNGSEVCPKCGSLMRQGQSEAQNYGNNYGGGQKNGVHTPSLVLMIIGLIFWIILPIVTYCTAIPSLVMSAKRTKEFSGCTVIIVLDILAIGLALINSFFGAIIMSGMF